MSPTTLGIILGPIICIALRYPKPFCWVVAGLVGVGAAIGFVLWMAAGWYYLITAGPECALLAAILWILMWR